MKADSAERERGAVARGCLAGRHGRVRVARVCEGFVRSLERHEELLLQLRRLQGHETRPGLVHATAPSCCGCAAWLTRSRNFSYRLSARSKMGSLEPPAASPRYTSWACGASRGRVSWACVVDVSWTCRGRVADVPAVEAGESVPPNLS